MTLVEKDVKHEQNMRKHGNRTDPGLVDQTELKWTYLTLNQTDLIVLKSISMQIENTRTNPIGTPNRYKSFLVSEIPI